MSATLTLTDAQVSVITVALLNQHKKLTEMLEFFRGDPDLKANAEGTERDLAALTGIVEQLPDWCQRFVADEIARGVDA